MQRFRIRTAFAVHSAHLAEHDILIACKPAIRIEQIRCAKGEVAAIILCFENLPAGWAARLLGWRFLYASSWRRKRSEEHVRDGQHFDERRGA